METMNGMLNVLQEPFLKTTQRNDKKDCLRPFRLCWGIKVVIPNTDFQPHLFFHLLYFHEGIVSYVLLQLLSIFLVKYKD